MTPAEVAAAKLQAKRARQRGVTVSPAIEAIANAERLPSLTRAERAREHLYDRIGEEFGLLTSAEAARRMGSPSGTSEGALAARRDHRLLAVRSGDEWLFPGFQFGAAGIRPAIGRLIEVAAEHHRTEEGLLQWLCSPTTYLDGSRPVDVLGDPERVLAVAREAFGVEW